MYTLDLFDTFGSPVNRFTPERLTLAREAKALSMTELAQAVGVTTSAISQFESGGSKPGFDLVRQLATQLDVPVSFLSAPPPPRLNLEDCHFRRRRSATKTEQQQIIATGKKLLEVVHFLEAHVEFPAATLPQLTVGSYKSQRRIETIAASVRDAWRLGFGPISHMTWLLESKGILVLEVKGHSERLDAFSVWSDSRPLVFVSSEKRSASRRRFDLAHELGHLVMHRTACPGSGELEHEADTFASSFLMPSQPLRAEFPSRLAWPYLVELKGRWKVSLEALVRRGFDLGLLSEATYRRAYVQLKKRGWRGAEPGEPPMERPALVASATAEVGRVGYSLGRISREMVHYTPEQLAAILSSAAA